MKNTAIWLLVLLAVVPVAEANSGSYTDFSQLPLYTRVRLAPDGNGIAFVKNYRKLGEAVLLAGNLATGKTKPLLSTDNQEVRINWFEWANNHTLLVSARYSSFRNRIKTEETRLFAIDVNAKKPELRLLVRPHTGGIVEQHLSQFQDNVIDLLPDDPTHILISIDLDIANLPAVYRLNIYSKNKHRIVHASHQIRNWMTDQQHHVRLGVALDYKSGEQNIYVRKSLDHEDWQPLFTYNGFKDPDIIPLGFAKDPNILYFSKVVDDKRAIFTIDLTTKKQTLVFKDPDYDADGSLLYSDKTGEVIGITHSNSPIGRIYFNKDWDNFQKSLDKALPDTDNYLIATSRDESRYILFSESDTIPGRYFIGDRRQHSMDFLFSQYPQLEGKLSLSKKLVTYPARDGTKIEGYLTLPENHKGPLPTILFPHGGPGAREYDGFDYWAAYFVSRGYAVFQPNFRGSTGYGYNFASSQMKGWGLTMQDDLTDAAHWLVKQGITKPHDMCIVGASYGGYAAAMAAVKTPDLFNCAVAFAGVFNLESLVRGSRYYLNHRFVKNQIGDDEDDLEARSPYFHVNKIHIPMLVMQGDEDRVVDIRQSRDFVEKMKDADKPVTYIELTNGNHHLSVQKNRDAVFKAMGQFLGQYLH